MSFQYFEDKHPGLTTGEPAVREVNNAHGQHYWIATAKIGTIFGAEVEGELKGIGPSREEALKRLAGEQAKLYESLWA